MTIDPLDVIPDFPGLLSLDGRSFVVAGAGAGMGRQTAHGLAQAGAKRILCVDVNEELARAVASEVGVGIPWIGDVTIRAEVQRLTSDAIAQLGRIDGLIDIVGGAITRVDGSTTSTDVVDIDDETFDIQMLRNLRQVYVLSQELGRVMVEQGGGTMVFVSSMSAFYAAPHRAAYGAAKAGVTAWIRTLAQELGPKHIRANGIAPGLTLTPRMAAAPIEQIETWAQVPPLRRNATPAEMAAVILFLMSDLSSYITGQTLVVDGGASIKSPWTPV